VVGSLGFGRNQATALAIALRGSASHLREQDEPGEQHRPVAYAFQTWAAKAPYSSDIPCDFVSLQLSQGFQEPTRSLLALDSAV
jgi:hypothetical protein